MLIKYLRESGIPYGCVVAIGPNKVGFSQCRKTDIFRKKDAINIAAGRASMGIGDNPSDLVRTPIEIRKNPGKPYRVTTQKLDEFAEAILLMRDRSVRYYKKERVYV